jgi:hypothetical protein
MELAKLKKSLGKRRLAKVFDIMDDGKVIDIQLHNGTGDLWDYTTDFTFNEIVFYAKEFIDEDGDLGIGE